MEQGNTFANWPTGDESIPKVRKKVCRNKSNISITLSGKWKTVWKRDKNITIQSHNVLTGVNSVAGWVPCKDGGDSSDSSKSMMSVHNSQISSARINAFIIGFQKGYLNTFTVC